jgi:beta-lactamase superfamily II metal-dependent hydrolase
LLKDKNIQKNIKKDVLNKILNEIVVSLIPHHGSKHNWDPKILEILKNCVFWVVSGEDRKYKHPSKEVFEEIISKERYVVWVNKKYKFILRNKVIWKPFVRFTEHCNK